MEDKLTRCGCEECEEKMGKLLNWVDSVMSRHPMPHLKSRCKFSIEIPIVPNQIRMTATEVGENMRRAFCHKSPSDRSVWDSWPKEKLEQELRDRIKYFYMKIDESYDFPNNREGDLLKMVHSLMAKRRQ